MAQNNSDPNPKVTAVITPETLARLDAYARSRRWSRSTAMAALVEQGLDQADEQDQEGR